MILDARFHAYKILHDFHKRSFQLGQAREEYFAKSYVPQRERQRVYVLTNEIMKFQARLNHLISKATNRSALSLDNEVLTVLQIAAYELLMDDRTPDYAAISSAVQLIENVRSFKLKGFVNASCRSLQKMFPISKNDFMTPADWYSLPKWMYKRWVTRFGKEDAEKLCDYFNSPGNITIRRNSEKMSARELELEFSELNVLYEQVEGTENFYNIIKGGSSLFKSDSFKKGLISVQDRAAGAVVEILEPQDGDTILDVCAAPGTKSLYISELVGNTGKVNASDYEKDRVGIAKSDFKRHHAKNIVWDVKNAASDDFDMADKILIDVPCSGTGVIQRRPDIRWNRQHGDLREFSESQKNILENMKKYVKPNGLIVYATCSLEPEENWLVVDAFLKLNKEFVLEKVEVPSLEKYVNQEGCFETFPPRDHMDGMFAAKLRRIE